MLASMLPKRINIIGSTGIIKNNYLNETVGSKTFLGGTGFTIAHTLARLGGTNVRFIGATGAGGEVFLSQLALAGIDVSDFIVYEDQPMPTGEVNTSSDGSQEWINFEDRVSRLTSAEVFETIGKDELTILSPINRSAFVKIQEILIKQGAVYLYDPGMMMHNLTDEQLLMGIRHARFVVANQHEFQTIETRLDLGIGSLASPDRIIIQTLGGEGVRVINGEVDETVKAYRTKGIDPTGAGDVWRAGFIYGLTTALPITEGIRLANIIASISVEHYGAIDFPIVPAEIKNRLNITEFKDELR